MLLPKTLKGECMGMTSEKDKGFIKLDGVKLDGIEIGCSDIKINPAYEQPSTSLKEANPIVYTFDLKDEQLDNFKKIILKKYGENIKRCMECKHATIIIDDDSTFRDIKCGLGAGKLAMLSNTHCILID